MVKPFLVGEAPQFLAFFMASVFGLATGHHYLSNRESDEDAEFVVACFDLLWIAGSTAADFFVYNELFNSAEIERYFNQSFKALWLAPWMFLLGLRLTKALFDLKMRLVRREPSGLGK